MMSRTAKASPITAQDLKRLTGWMPHGERDGVWVEVKEGVHNSRDLRSTLVNLAYAAKLDAGKIAMAVLMNSRIAWKRLDNEIGLFSSLIGPEVASRIKIFTCQDPGDVHFERAVPRGEFAHWLERLIREKQSTTGKSSSKHSVAGLMFLLLLQKKSPLTAAEIGLLAGASHPTVSSVLQDFELRNSIARVAGKVHFKSFPMVQWTRWLNVEVATRKKVFFVDESGLAKSPESLARRLAKLNRDDVAVGGLLGAKQHYPGLDLAGSTRLDVVVNGSISADLSFVKELDPALVETKQSKANASVVVHFIGRPTAFFEKSADGFVWADPVVCMTDLQEAGFDQQSSDLLQKLGSKRSE